jgi:electron transfer flavoprotein alpha/beta subunit
MGSMSTPDRWAVAVKHGIDVTLTRPDPAGGRIDLARAPRKTSDFDQNAVEEAVRLREKHGGTVPAVTVGPATFREAIRDALTCGADEGILQTPPEGVVADSKMLVAIHKDAYAPIFQQADYQVIGDLYAILPELTRRLAATPTGPS